MNNRPTPDPSWDYAVIWQQLCELESKLDEIINFLQNQETLTPQSSTQLLFYLGCLDGMLDGVFDLVPHQK